VSSPSQAKIHNDMAHKALKSIPMRNIVNAKQAGNENAPNLYLYRVGAIPVEVFYYITPMDKTLVPLKNAYNVAMDFIESESMKKKPSTIGSVSWTNLKNELNFLDKNKSDRVMNWLIENWPPRSNYSMPYLTENERNAFDSDAYRLLLRSYRTRMVPERFIEDIIVRGVDYDGLHFSKEFLHNCLAKFWEDSMQEIPQSCIH